MTVIGHRGVPSEAPQNTLAGLRRAIAFGLDYVELDLRATRDAKIVDIHNSMVDETIDGKGRVADLTLAELRKLDAGSHFGPQFRGERIPLFAEELALAKGRIKLYLDVKDADPLRVLALLEQFDMVGDAVFFCGPEQLAALQAANRGVQMMPRLARAEDMPELARRLQPQFVERGGGPLDEAAITAAHAHGAQYFLDIQGEGDTPEYVLACLRAGVDGVQTDHPVLVLDTLRQAGVVRPAPGPAPALPPVPGTRPDGRRVKLISHRGVNQRAPQNTLAATRESIALGLDFIEVDLRTTADGLLVDIHNSTVEGTTNGKGAVRELRYAQMRALDAGSWFSPRFAAEHIPLLGEVLALARDRCGIYLDWKDADPRPVVRLLQEFDLASQVLVHADEETCRQVRALEPGVILLPGADGSEDIRHLARSLHPQAVELRWRHFTPEAVQECHRLGMLCATSLAGGRGDTREEMERAVAAGIQIIETDQPDLLLEVLKGRPQGK